MSRLIRATATLDRRLDAICIEEDRGYAERTAPRIATVLHAGPELRIIEHSA